MNCPVCKDTKLVMAERQGIEIDYCPGCRGVWLDRGELDKIIDRSAGEQIPQLQRHADLRRDDDHYKHTHKRKKREGFLGDLFDF
jgi:Zn-finger nucleic acid-binding protein